MQRFSDAVEERIQRILPASTPILIEGSSVYLLSYQNDHFLRYVEENKHLTVGCRREVIGEPWYSSISVIARTLFAPKEYIVELSSPVCWDNELDHIPEDKLRVILSRIIKAVCRKYKRCKIEIDGAEETA
jgi:hypothetical protein